MVRQTRKCPTKVAGHVASKSGSTPYENHQAIQHGPVGRIEPKIDAGCVINHSLRGGRNDP